MPFQRKSWAITFWNFLKSSARQKSRTKQFKILGVNNKVGLFDAYTEAGRKIKQPYQRVEDGCLAYNPYRVNVGSIGLKTAGQKHDLISSAYVIFKCREIVVAGISLPAFPF